MKPTPASKRLLSTLKVNARELPGYVLDWEKRGALRQAEVGKKIYRESIAELKRRGHDVKEIAL